MTRRVAVILRADKDIATGHLMRVNSIIRELSNCEFTLYSTSLDESLYSLCSLYKDIYVKDLESIALLIKENNYDLTIIDDYSIDAKFEDKIYPYTKVFIVDDLANRPHKAHIVLDPCLVRIKEDYKDLVNEDCTLLVNKEYSLVKKEFSLIKRDFVKDNFKVIVSYGGADPVGATKTTLNSILDGKLYTKYDFVFLTGKANPDYDYIEDVCKDIANIDVLKHTDNVPKLFQDVHLAIGAYGGMFNERICAKIPSICVTIADNQVFGLASLQKYNIGLDCTLDEIKDYKIIDKKLSYLKEHYREFVNNCSLVYDGLGIEHIICNIEKLLTK